MLLGNGDGTFGPHGQWGAGDSPYHVTAADLDAAVRTIAGSARSMGVTVEGV